MVLRLSIVALATITGLGHSQDASDPPLLTVAGSGTVYPVALGWQTLLPSNYTYMIEPGGSSTGARRVCSPYDDETHVHIGMMSRDWRTSEVERLDDGATLECLDRDTGERTGRRVTQLQVGLDGISFAVRRTGAAHSCLTSPAVGGLSTAQLRWIFSAWSDEQLAAPADGNINFESIVPGDNHDGIKQWSDIHPSCAMEPIHPYGAGSRSGTTDVVSSAIFIGDDEGFSICNLTKVDYLVSLGQEETVEYIQNHRDEMGSSPNCLVPSEIDDFVRVKDWLLADSSGIAYFGYAFVNTFSGELTAARVADDPVLGATDTQVAKVAPSLYTILDGSYSLFTRSLYMNVDNTAWDIVRTYLLAGFSDTGTARVESIGYLGVNAAVKARNIIRIQLGANLDADYVIFPPENCWNGTELVSSSYISSSGITKDNYTCDPCAPGSFKWANTPTLCQHCTAGTVSRLAGASACDLCDVGRFTNSTTSTECLACSAGSAVAARGSSSCAACQSGTYQPDIGMSTCIQCPMGQFQPLAGMASCKACEPGTFSTIEGSVSCSSCQPGSFQAAAGANASCTRCPVGTYSDVTGSDRCTSCLDGLTTRYVGSRGIDECICPEGFFMPAGMNSSFESPCDPCPAGMRCPLGSNYAYLPGVADAGFQCPDDDVCSYPEVLVGHMTVTGKPLEVYKCISEGFCPGKDPATCASLRDANEVACGRCVANAYSQGDKCKQCGNGPNVLIIIFACVLLVVGLFAAVFAINRDLVKQSNATVSVGVVAGLTFGGMQTLGVFSSLNLGWFEPMKSIVEFASVFGLDFQSLRVSCQVGTNPFVNYLFRQLVAPCLVPVIFGLLLIKQRVTKKDVNLKVELTNTVGAVYFIIFISVVISALTPVVCYNHPGSTGSSVVAMPSVLCFEDSSWYGLLVTGICALAFVTIPYLALCVYGIVRYKKMVTNGNLNLLKAFQFLFIRFRSERYFYGGILLLRNFTIPCIPALIRGDTVFQLVLMCFVVLVFMAIQIFLRPWRKLSVNIFDATLSLFIVLVLICACASSTFTASKESIMVLGTAIFTIECVLVVLFFFGLVLSRAVKKKQYDYFLCHHKQDAAAQARLLKISLVQLGKAKVFIDSDDLLQLDGLFEVVKLGVQRLVVYLTKDTLARPWCCGEVVTAHQNKINTVTIPTVSFAMPQAPYTCEQCEEFLNIKDSCLMNYGMSVKHVHEAYSWLLFDVAVAKLQLTTTANGTKRISLLARALVGKKTTGRASCGTGDGSSMDFKVSKGLLLISSDPADDEASATAGILTSKVQSSIAEMGQGPVMCLCDHSSEILFEQPEYFMQTMKDSLAAIIVLTRDSLQCVPQLQVLMLASAFGLMNGGLIPVITPYFLFPTEAYYSTTLPTLSRRVAVVTDADELVGIVRSVFKIIAVTLGTHSSDTVLTAQAVEICRRIASNEKSVRDVATKDMSGLISAVTSTRGSQSQLASPAEVLGSGHGDGSNAAGEAEKAGGSGKDKAEPLNNLNELKLAELQNSMQVTLGNGHLIWAENV